MTRRIKRRGESVIVTLPEEEIELLRTIPAQLEPLFRSEPTENDPVFKRLFPTAYLDPTQEEAEREWQELVHPDLLRQRLAALELVRRTLEGGVVKRGGIEVTLTPPEVEAWLGVLNDARLAVGTRLGVSDDPEARDVDPASPEAPAHALYGWLTWLEGDLVETLLR